MTEAEYKQKILELEAEIGRLTINNNKLHKKINSLRVDKVQHDTFEHMKKQVKQLQGIVVAREKSRKELMKKLFDEFNDEFIEIIREEGWRDGGY